MFKKIAYAPSLASVLARRTSQFGEQYWQGTLDGDFKSVETTELDLVRYYENWLNGLPQDGMLQYAGIPLKYRILPKDIDFNIETRTLTAIMSANKQELANLKINFDRNKARPFHPNMSTEKPLWYQLVLVSDDLFYPLIQSYLNQQQTENKLMSVSVYDWLSNGRWITELAPDHFDSLLLLVALKDHLHQLPERNQAEFVVSFLSGTGDTMLIGNNPASGQCGLDTSIAMRDAITFLNLGVFDSLNEGNTDKWITMSLLELAQEKLTSVYSRYRPDGAESRAAVRSKQLPLVRHGQVILKMGSQSVKVNLDPQEVIEHVRQYLAVKSSANYDTALGFIKSIESELKFRTRDDIAGTHFSTAGIELPMDVSSGSLTAILRKTGVLKPSILPQDIERLLDTLLQPYKVENCKWDTSFEVPLMDALNAYAHFGGHFLRYILHQDGFTPGFIKLIAQIYLSATTDGPSVLRNILADLPDHVDLIALKKVIEVLFDRETPAINYDRFFRQINPRLLENYDWSSVLNEFKSEIYDEINSQNSESPIIVIHPPPGQTFDLRRFLGTVRLPFFMNGPNENLFQTLLPTSREIDLDEIGGRVGQGVGNVVYSVGTDQPQDEINNPNTINEQDEPANRSQLPAQQEHQPNVLSSLGNPIPIPEPILLPTASLFKLRPQQALTADDNQQFDDTITQIIEVLAIWVEHGTTGRANLPSFNPQSRQSPQPNSETSNATAPEIIQALIQQLLSGHMELQGHDHEITPADFRMAQYIIAANQMADISDPNASNIAQWKENTHKLLQAQLDKEQDHPTNKLLIQKLGERWGCSTVCADLAARIIVELRKKNYSIRNSRKFNQIRPTLIKFIGDISAQFGQDALPVKALIKANISPKKYSKNLF